MSILIWQIGRHPNVYVNLEITMMEAVLSPQSFIDTREELLWVGDKRAIDKILYGSGAPNFHPRLFLEEFWEFDFPEMEWMGGTYTITKEDKAKILGKNFAAAHNFDLKELKAQTADASEERDELADPYSTTQFEVVEA